MLFISKITKKYLEVQIFKKVELLNHFIHAFWVYFAFRKKCTFAKKNSK